MTGGSRLGGSVVEPLEWRLSRRSVLLMLLSPIGITLTTMGAAFNAFDQRWWHVGFFWICAVLFVVSWFVVGTVCLRTRVRLTEAGVEIREFRTRLYRYSDITDARADRWAYGRVKLTLRGGSTRQLPVPIQSKPPSDSAVERALLAIRHRSGLASESPAVAWWRVD